MKRRLLAELGAGLAAAGYQRVPGPTIVSGLFWKRHEELVLLLGVDFSRRYEERFTGSYYLSRSFAFSVPFEGLPREVYERLGHFLTSEERRRLLAADYQSEGVVDAWWIGVGPEVQASFLESVRLTEPRYLAPSLVDAVRSNEAVKEHRAIVDEVVARVRAGVTAKGLTHQPKRLPKEVPPEYFWAAEVVAAARRSPHLAPAYVEMLALDAYRVGTLLGPPGQVRG